jgi:signal transduction histidine kinase
LIDQTNKPSAFTGHKNFMEMLMSSPALPKITDSFSSLNFFYDPLHKKILFSNMPLQHFFGSEVDMEDEFPFSFISDSKEARDISNEWQTCLQLREKQTHQFWFHRPFSDGSDVVFHFQATGIRVENNPGTTQCILFTAEKSPAGTNSAWMIESERLRKTLNRYKEEYAEFIDIAAHNLDAPLRKLSVLMERLTAKPTVQKDADTQGYTQRIRTCLDDMRSLIDSLATLSRITSATLKVDSCSLETIVEHEWQELKSLIKGKTALITTSSLPILEGDTLQYKYLFRNLLENAIRFSKTDGPVEVHISSQAISSKEKNSYGLHSDTNYFKIECRDSGIGFRQEYAEKIFRPFVRLHGKSEFPGNGIGLALCRSIVDNHRGVIYAESEENAGARFILVLPQTIN